MKCSTKSRIVLVLNFYTKHANTGWKLVKHIQINSLCACSCWRTFFFKIKFFKQVFQELIKSVKISDRMEKCVTHYQTIFQKQDDLILIAWL